MIIINLFPKEPTIFYYVLWIINQLYIYHIEYEALLELELIY
jgi:hypothetical protein